MASQIFIDGVGGTYDVFGFTVTNESKWPVAVPKIYTVDIPGGDGSIDLTDAMAGAVAFSDVEHTIVFATADVAGSFGKRQKLVNALSGKLLEYELSWDPGYTYRGRWSFGDVEIVGDRYAKLTVPTRTEPYKRKPDLTYRVKAGGGANVRLPSGRMRVSPVFDCARPAVVTCNGLSKTLPAGSHKVRGLYLREGENDMYVNSSPDLTAALWGDLSAYKWGDFGGATWAEAAWRGHERPTGDQYDVYVTYEWGDL